MPLKPTPTESASDEDWGLGAIAISITMKQNQLSTKTNQYKMLKIIFFPKAHADPSNIFYRLRETQLN